mmetsp:Transcript_88160/g.221930  ORF Transcript_88160/g.221930 Transcript_88160/m.221930 type:complete len:263 (-) Transcript_88160:64-852(-)
MPRRQRAATRTAKRPQANSSRASAAPGCWDPSRRLWTSPWRPTDPYPGGRRRTVLTTSGSRRSRRSRLRRPRRRASRPQRWATCSTWRPGCRPLRTSRICRWCLAWRSSTSSTPRRLRRAPALRAPDLQLLRALPVLALQVVCRRRRLQLWSSFGWVVDPQRASWAQPSSARTTSPRRRIRTMTRTTTIGSIARRRTSLRSLSRLRQLPQWPPRPQFRLTQRRQQRRQRLRRLSSCLLQRHRRPSSRPRARRPHLRDRSAST